MVAVAVADGRLSGKLGLDAGLHGGDWVGCGRVGICGRWCLRGVLFVGSREDGVVDMGVIVVAWFSAQ